MDECMTLHTRMHAFFVFNFLCIMSSDLPSFRICFLLCISYIIEISHTAHSTQSAVVDRFLMPSMPPSHRFRIIIFIFIPYCFFYSNISSLPYFFGMMIARIFYHISILSALWPRIDIPIQLRMASRSRINGSRICWMLVILQIAYSCLLLPSLLFPSKVNHVMQKGIGEKRSKDIGRQNHFFAVYSLACNLAGPTEHNFGIFHILWGKPSSEHVRDSIRLFFMKIVPSA